MSYSKYQELENSVTNPGEFYSWPDKGMVDSFLEKEEKRNEKIKKQPFVYFYEDIIQDVLKVAYDKHLSKTDFKNMKDDAKDCLEICPEFSKISSRAIHSWLSSSLKVTDYIILDFIQVKRKETVKKYKKLGVERSRYRHLSEDKDELIKEVGQKLDALYELRNKNEHRTVTDKEGRQSIVRPNQHQNRKTVIAYYPMILKNLKEVYSKLK